MVPAAAAACRAAAAAAAATRRAGDQRGRPAQARAQVPPQRQAPHARMALRHTSTRLWQCERLRPFTKPHLQELECLSD